MSFFEISSTELKSRMEELKELNSRFKTVKEGLEQSEQTLRSMWEGDANENFHNAFIRDSGQFDAFYSTIEQYVAALTLIGERYDTAERRNQELAANRSY